MADHRPQRPRRPATGRKPSAQGAGRGRNEPRSSGRGRSDDRERLQKLLAHAGLGSRRGCEELILQGRVTVDGQVVRELGTKVDPKTAKIAVDGQSIRPERMVYFAVYKPKGYVSTNHDPSGRPRVIDLLPELPERVYTVGRLDEMSTGLMLLTNDGELANRLAHPRYGVEKLYRVIVAGVPAKEVLGQLTEGVWLAEGKVRAKRVRAVGRKGEATILEMVLAEGKNREVRRMLAKLGHKVMSLTRVAVGPITIKGLSAGQFRPLSPREIDLLHRVAAGETIPPVGFSTERKPSQAPGRPAGTQSAAKRPRTNERAERPARRQDAGPKPGHVRPGPSGKPSGPRPLRPQGPPPSQRRPRDPEEIEVITGPSDAPVRPEGPPPSQHRSSAGVTRKDRAGSTPERPARKIVGLDAEGAAGGPPRPRSRRPPAKRPFPRAALGPRRPRPKNDGQEQGGE